MSSLTESAPRSPRPRLLGAAVAAVIVTAAVIAIVLLVTSTFGGSSASAGHELKYGGIPKWLPKTHSSPDRILTATPAKPVLAIQGNTVSVDEHGAKILATAVGPEVPEEGEFPVPATSPCTFVVTFARGSAAVPIVPSDFTVTDEEGHLHHLKITGMHGGPPPAQVPAGKTVSVKASGVLPTGNGALRWAPAGKPLVAWDFSVEID
ncbi:MAG: hypothetical protein JST59_04185 [Actinobacteria bacterium]|nr:hypothetical protein [Actinomycetota bacterium]